MDAAADTTPDHAICILRAVAGSKVAGTLHLSAKSGGVEIKGRITGLGPGKHGFHVHQFGDLSDIEKGESAGSHFAPDGNPHGRPGDSARHVGDLGNIEAGDDGSAEIQIHDRVVRLSGPHSIIGRALVVHEKADDFGQPSGNAGGRVAFGVIAVAKGTER